MCAVGSRSACLAGAGCALVVCLCSSWLAAQPAPRPKRDTFHYCLVTDRSEGYVAFFSDVFRYLPGIPERATELVLQEGSLPAQLREWVAGLPTHECGLLYFLSSPDGPTYEQFPLADLARVLEDVKCRYIITVLDLPTPERQWREVSLQDIIRARERYEILKGENVVFTSGPFQVREWRRWHSSFAEYFDVGLSGHADAGWDRATTVREAYEYAFWCVYAESRGRQTPLWRDNGHADYVVLSTDWPWEPDPQAILFAQTSVRFSPPFDPPGPLGRVGRSGPGWASWWQGPAPEVTSAEELSRWAAHEMKLIDEKLDEAAGRYALLQQLAADAPARMPPSPHSGKLVFACALPEGPPGLPGRPAPESEETKLSRKRGVDSIADADLREMAAENDRGLEWNERALQWLQAEVAELEDMVIHYYTLVAPCPSRAYGTPRGWPQNLGVYPPWESPAGESGYPGQPAEEAPELAQGPRPALWSAEVTEVLNRQATHIRELRDGVRELKAEFRAETGCFSWPDAWFEESHP